MPKRKGLAKQAPKPIPKLHLYHIPRTGGMSLNWFMRRHNKVDGVKHLAWHINGHAHYRAFDPSYFTLIGMRSPVAHMASLYKYIARSRNHKEGSRVSGMSFDRFIAQCRDSYFGFLTIKGSRSVEQAKTHLSGMSFVYLTDNLDNDMRVFLRYMHAGIRWQNIRHNSTPPMKVTKAQIRAIRKKRARDFEIYEAAKKLNTAQLAFFREHRREEMLPDLDWSGVIV